MSKLTDGKYTITGEHRPPARLVHPALTCVLVQSCAWMGGLASSKSEARRLIASGGVSINNTRVEDAAGCVLAEHVVHGSVTLLRKGKKHHVLVKWLTA